MTIVVSIYNPYTSIQFFIWNLAYKLALHRWQGIKFEHDVEHETRLFLGFVTLGFFDLS